MTHYHALEKFEKVMSVVCVVLLLIYPSMSFHTEQVVTAQGHDRLTYRISRYYQHDSDNW